MIKLKSILVVVLLFVFVYAKAQTVTVKQVPNTVEDFVKYRDKIAKTPEGGATIFLLALKISHQLFLKLL